MTENVKRLQSFFVDTQEYFKTHEVQIPEVEFSKEDRKYVDKHYKDKLNKYYPGGLTDVNPENKFQVL